MKRPFGLHFTAFRTGFSVVDDVKKKPLKTDQMRSCDTLGRSRAWEGPVHCFDTLTDRLALSHATGPQAAALTHRTEHRMLFTLTTSLPLSGRKTWTSPTRSNNWYERPFLRFYPRTVHRQRPSSLALIMRWRSYVATGPL